MTTLRTIMLGLLLWPMPAVICAQEAPASKRAPAPPEPTVTVSLSDKGVRFVAFDALGQMRLEVFSPGGDSLYNSGFQPGTVRDWAVQDRQGQPLADGAYLCVVTLRDLTGRLSVRQGTVQVQGGQASLQLHEGEPEKMLTTVKEGAGTAAALLAHNSKDGQLISTRGGLTFRLGDFFGGKDRELMRLTPEGNLGLGTSAPQARLDVVGDISASGFLRAAKGVAFPDGTVQTSGLSGRKDASGDIVPLAAGTGTAGRLAKWAETGGSGTLSDSLLGESGLGVEVRPAAAGTGVNPLILNASNVPNFAQFQFYPVTGPNANMSFAVIPKGTGVANNRAQFSIFGTDFLADSTNYEFASMRARGTDFVLGTGRSGSGVVRPFMLAAGFLSDNVTNNGQLFLATNGNVGIGTVSPQVRLDVAGDVQVSGNIAAKYQDVAEWVPARGRLAAGTVVSLDVKLANAVAASARAYDTRVAGVVSARPGLSLGEGGADKVLVATTGRVKVRVDATHRPIRVGDLLVTGDKPGVAMRSQPIRIAGTLIHRPGTIIGKALEPLAAGTGEILVLLSLQ